MFNYYLSDFDRTLSLLDEFRRRMDLVFEDVDTRTWPRANLYDAGATLRLEMELPGVADTDVQLTLNQEVLTLKGKRKADPPEGYSVHRRERGALEFSRSFSLPCKVDPEKVTATLKDGVLKVELHKAPEAQPRQIVVKGN